ncbi:MAG: HNH endonuclease [Myxococcota bacterium]
MGLALLVCDGRRGATYECGAERGSSGARGWKELHERLVSFAKRRAGLEWEEGRLLCDALRAGVHRRLGFASFGEYVGRLLGYNGRLVKEKLRVAQGLEALPLTSEALRTGELTWSAVRELTRVATVDSEREWLTAAHGLTVRQVEELVSGRALGDLPSDPEDPKLRRHVLRFEVAGETRALVLDALAKLRRDAGEALDDDSALLLMARKLLTESGEDADAEKTEAEVDAEKLKAAKANAARASYQVLVTTCRACGRSEQIGHGERHAIAPEVLEMSLCDAQIVDDSVEPHVGQRPKQTIPSALRTYVWRRDNGRCVVSGCKHADHVDVHHLVPREENGPNQRDNLACLCSAHHRAVHAGRLIIEGKPSSGLTFKHADGTRYGGVVQADAVDRNAQVFAGLRGLGFKERECRSALERCSATVAPTASREEVLRTALNLLAWPFR